MIRRLALAALLASLVLAASWMPASAAGRKAPAGYAWPLTVRTAHPTTVDVRHLSPSSGPRPVIAHAPLARDPGRLGTGKAATSAAPANRTLAPRTRGVATTTFPAHITGISDSQQAADMFVKFAAEPPDTQMAVSSTQVVEIVNVSYQLYDRATLMPVLPHLVAIDNLFSIPVGFSAGDVRVLFDSQTSLWYASALAYNGPNNTGLVAFAWTNTPAMSWHTLLISTGSGICDQPKIGYGSDEVVLACSQFSSISNPTYQGAVVVIISEADVQNNAQVIHYAITSPSPSHYALVPSQDLNMGDSGDWLIENFGTSMGILRSMGDPASTTPTFTFTTMPIAPTAVPPSAVQPGTNGTIDTGDDRFMSSVIRNQYLWTSTTVACTPNGDSFVRSCIRLIEVQLSNSMTMKQDFTVGGAVGEYLYYPTLALDSSNNAVIDISRSSSGYSPSHGVFVEFSGTTTLVDEGIADAGVSPYTGFNNVSAPWRWGDYGAAAYDPGAANSVWFAGEYSLGIGAQWGTGIGQMTFTTLSMTPSGLGYGRIALGLTSAPQGVTVTNTGTVAANLTALLDSGNTDQFHIVDNSCANAALAPNGTCTAHFTFNPTSSGDKQARLDITGSNFPPVTLVLTGTGIGSACASTAIATDLMSPQNVGAHVVLSATSAGCPDPNPRYRFWLRDTNANWNIVQDFSAATSFAWDTSTYAPGTYLTGVWVKDANSSNSYDAYAFGTFTIGEPACSSTDITSDVQSPQNVGVMVHFTATQMGCPNPLYQWWVRDNAGNWSIAVPFGASNAFAWNTSTLTEGTYEIGVWARQLHSGNTYDAFAFVTYTLAAPKCASTSLGTNPGLPAATGSMVTLTAIIGTCTGLNLQFRFWIRDTAQVWHMVQDFSASDTYMWTSSSSPVNTNTAGTYLLGVWERTLGSVSVYDAFAFITFSLTSGPTCVVEIAGDHTSPQATGTTVNWTATAPTCPGTPLSYQFWVMPPGGTWTIAQAFAPGNTFAWTANTAGTYQIGVWVRQNGMTYAYDNFAFTTFTLSPTAPATPVCSSVGAVPGVPSPGSVGTDVTFTATAPMCTMPEYQWWVRDTNANWAIAQPFSNGNAIFLWHTTGLTPGTYLIGVWARQHGSAATYEAYYFLTYTLNGPPVQRCSSTNLAPDLSSPRSPGVTVTFTATAAGCGTPDFEFFVSPPGGSFAVQQAFSATNTFPWNTTGLAPGPYEIGVWARQHGSSASYEAFAFITYQLTGASAGCAVLTLTASSQLIHPGKSAGITVTAAAAGCTTPLYQYYVRVPGGSYVVYQSYGGATSVSWPPPPIAGPTPEYLPGVYSVLVLARDMTSSATYETFAVLDFLVDPEY